MNKLSVNAAIKRLGDVKDKTEAEIKELLAKDEKNFSVEDIEEIFATLKGEKPAKAESKKDVKDTKPKHLNEGLGLEDIDYNNFMPLVSTNEDDETIFKSTEDFQKYREIEKNLVWNKSYKFDYIKARGQYRKKADGTQVLVGIRIISHDPINSPTIEARHVIGLFKDHTGLNSQVHNPENDKFYLLQKP